MILMSIAGQWKNEDGYTPQLPWQTIDLEPEVQVGATETYQALRNTDMHNNIFMTAPGVYG